MKNRSRPVNSLRHPSNALHKLNRYIRDVKGLKEALIRHGYHSKDRSITPKQVQIFYDF